MSDGRMVTKIGTKLLIEAFPASTSADALSAAENIHRQLQDNQWADLLELNVGEEVIRIPGRLRFEIVSSTDHPANDVELMMECLRTKSGDGFERQRALQSILGDVRPWSAPFIIALIGEYVVEILDDIYAGLSRANSDELASFISANPRYWEVTKQRVASYWNVYYRRRHSRSNYVGFKIIRELDAEVCKRSNGRL